MAYKFSDDIDKSIPNELSSFQNIDEFKMELINSICQIQNKFKTESKIAMFVMSSDGENAMHYTNDNMFDFN